MSEQEQRIQKSVLWIKAETLKPYEGNSRKHPQEQIEKIKASLVRFGWINPILIDEFNRVMAGHGRLQAGKELGHEKVPCLKVSGLSEAEFKAYVIADNRLAELAEWDDAILLKELQGLKDAGEIEATGFSLDSLEKLMEESAEPSAPSEFPDAEEGMKTEHECPKCGYKWSGGQKT